MARRRSAHGSPVEKADAHGTLKADVQVFYFKNAGCQGRSQSSWGEGLPPSTGLESSVLSHRVWRTATRVAHSLTRLPAGRTPVARTRAAKDVDSGSVLW